MILTWLMFLILAFNILIYDAIISVIHHSTVLQCLCRHGPDPARRQNARTVRWHRGKRSRAISVTDRSMAGLWPFNAVGRTLGPDDNPAMTWFTGSGRVTCVESSTKGLSWMPQSFCCKLAPTRSEHCQARPVTVNPQAAPII